MTTPDAGQRLIEWLRAARDRAKKFGDTDLASNFGLAVSEIERLRVDAERAHDAWRAAVRCYLLGRFSDMPRDMAAAAVERTMKGFEEAIAATAPKSVMDAREGE